MKRNLTRWFQKSSVNPRTAITITILWATVLLAGHWFLPMRVIESKVISPILFKSREALKRAPELHPSIKLFAIDDVAAAKLEKGELSLTEWANALEILDRSKPKAIIIDAMFSLQNIESTEEGRKALSRLKAIKTPIYTGVYASNSTIEGRVPLDLDKPAYSIASYIDPNNRIPGTEQEQIDKLPMGDYRKSMIYGSHASLRSVFNHAGHILYGNDEGSYFPFLRLKDNKTVPQIMMMPFEDVLFHQNRLMVNGNEIPLNADGSAPVNYLGVQKITEKVNSIYKLTLPENAKARLSTVTQGDFVFIIPLFYTGNVDFKPTPVGLVPGAFLHASVLNSILQKSQLQNMEIEAILILGFAAAVAYFGWWMGPSTLVLALIAVSAAWIAACVGSFSYRGMILPFLLPQTAIIGVGVSLLLQRIYIAERKARMIRSTLEGVVRPEALKMLQRNPEKLSLQARERVVTVVFIDIVGFSLMVENQLPRVAFEGLQQLVESMTTLIHKHGGIVNKTLGDGILCFFGYSLEDNKEIGNHAEEALSAALEIQSTNLPRVLAAEGRKDPVFPLRIGINTSAVFMGNLGAGERLDITVIGNGVNFAKRLEAACEPHAVLVGSTTRDLVRPSAGLVNPTRRLISIKHHDELVEAWEYDPLSTSVGLRARADRIYEASAQIHRRVRRWDMESDVRIAINSGFGNGQLISFWDGGLKFEQDNMISRGTLFEVSLDSSDGVLHRQLAKQGLSQIKMEVSAVEHIESKYIHHVRIVGLDPRQSTIVLDLLEQFGPKMDQAHRSA